MTQIILTTRPSIAHRYVTIDVDPIVLERLSSEVERRNLMESISRQARADGAPAEVSPRIEKGKNAWDRDTYVFEWWVVNL